MNAWINNIGPKYLFVYRQTSNISRTKSKTFNVSRLVLQLSLPNPLIKSTIKM